MAKHSDGKNNYRLSPSVIAIAIVIVLVAAGVFLWTQAKREDSAKSSCINGNLTLPIATNNKEVASQIIDAYNSSGRVTRDYCVRAELTDSVAHAGVYLSDESDHQVNQVLSAEKRSPATLEWPTVATDQVGIARREDATEDAPVTYPVKSDAVSSALVAAFTHNNDASAATKMLRDFSETTIDSAVAQSAPKIVVSKSETPQGYSFEEIQNLSKPLRAVALNPTDSVNEEVVRAGADFGTAIAANTPDAQKPQKLSQEVATAAEILASLTDSSPAVDSQSNQSPRDILMLLDTSEYINGVSTDGIRWFDAASHGLINLAQKQEERGKAIGLWNYSSPLTPGITQGWRSNLDFDTLDAARQVKDVLGNFGTGGQPQTLAATSAALNYAVEHAQHAGNTSVVIVFTGTNDSFTGLAESVRKAQESHVSLHAIQIGDGQDDTNIAQAAKDTNGSYVHATSAAELDRAIASTTK